MEASPRRRLPAAPQTQLSNLSRFQDPFGCTTRQILVPIPPTHLTRYSVEKPRPRLLTHLRSRRSMSDSSAPSTITGGCLIWLCPPERVIFSPSLQLRCGRSFITPSTAIMARRMDIANFGFLVSFIWAIWSIGFDWVCLGAFPGVICLWFVPRIRFGFVP